MKKIKVIFIIIVFISIFIFLNKLLSVKYADSLIEGSMISEYYNSYFDHDVIFLGDCEVYANVSPLVMYQNSGIKSFVRGSSQQLIWQTYYILKETLNYETPQIVAINITSIASGYDSGKMNEAYNRLLLDKMKWSKEKVELINASMTEKETFISYVFPLLRYHSRYDELSSEDFKYLFKDKKNSYNGFLINKNVKSLSNLPTKKVLSTYEFDEECLEYLNKIVELCKNNNIELVLFKSPSLYPYWYSEYDKYIEEYSNKNGITYYNFLNNIDDIGLDYNTDTYDGGLHLNLDGATKFSKYFGYILSNDFNIKSKNDPKYNELLRNYLDATEK